MLVEELKSYVAQQPDIKRVKELIQGINEMGPRPEDLQGIKQSKVLPVKLANGRIELRSMTTDFALVNREDYDQAFNGKIAVLDFSLGQVHGLKLFLTAFGLNDRCLSKIVKELPSVESGSYDNGLTNKFRQKANALFRYRRTQRDQLRLADHAPDVQ